MRDKISLHQYVLFAFLALLILWKFITKNLFLDINLLWWLLGAVLGFLFVFFDGVIFNFLVRSEEKMNVRLEGVFRDSLSGERLMYLLNERNEQKEMAMRSFLFLVVWMILGLLATTSIVSPFGRGFVLGIGIHLTFDFIYDYFWNSERFGKWFWQIKRELGYQEKRWFVLIFSVVFLLLAFRF